MCFTSAYNQILRLYKEGFEEKTLRNDGNFGALPKSKTFVHKQMYCLFWYHMKILLASSYILSCFIYFKCYFDFTSKHRLPWNLEAWLHLLHKLCSVYWKSLKKTLWIPFFLFLYIVSTELKHMDYCKRTIAIGYMVEWQPVLDHFEEYLSLSLLCTNIIVIPILLSAGKVFSIINDVMLCVVVAGVAAEGMLCSCSTHFAWRASRD